MGNEMFYRFTICIVWDQIAAPDTTGKQLIIKNATVVAI